MSARRLWSPDEIDLVMWCYEDTPTAELAELMDRSATSIYQLANRLDLQKSRECISEVSRRKIMQPGHGARRTQFPKVHVPQNKGIRTPGWAPGRMAQTQFKKGQVSRNWMPIGATRKIDGYLYRKISDVRNVPYTVNWKPEHVLLWQRKRGPVPTGHVIVFKDGNRDRILISNLECISRGDLAKRNSFHNLPEPLKELIRLNAAIRRSITCRRKRAEKQNV